MIRTFGELPEGSVFQIIWTVPGPMPSPPPETIFTKIALRDGANAVFIHDAVAAQNAALVAVPDDTKVLQLSRKFALTIEEMDQSKTQTTKHLAYRDYFHPERNQFLCPNCEQWRAPLRNQVNTLCVCGTHNRLVDGELISTTQARP